MALPRILTGIIAEASKPVDERVLEALLRKESSYGSVPFGVAHATIACGRKLKVEQYFLHRDTTISGSTGIISQAAANLSKEEQDFLKKKLDERKKKIAAQKKKVGFNTPDGVSDELDPGEDVPSIFDQGGIPNKVTATIFFVDTVDTVAHTRQSYAFHRDAFLSKVNSGGAHLLKLPSYKPFPAIAGECNITWRNTAGGIEYAEVTFFRSTKNPNLLTTDTASKATVTDFYETLAKDVAESQQEILDAVANDSGTIPNDASSSFIGNVIDKISEFADKVSQIKSAILLKAGAITGTIDAVIQDVENITNAVSSLIQLPADLVGSVLNSYASLLEAIVSPVDALRDMISKFSTFSSTFEGLTQSALERLRWDQKDWYSTTTSQLHMNASFGGMLQAAQEVPYASVEEAEEALTELADAYEKLKRVSSAFPEFSDSLYAASNMYDQARRYILEQVVFLPDVREIKFGTANPLIVTAYALYGDIGREEELATRNNIKNRLIPPTTLEVLTE